MRAMQAAGTLDDANVTIVLTGDEDRHVITGGYGRSGTGSLGSVQGIDFRRRAAENLRRATEVKIIPTPAVPNPQGRRTSWRELADR